MKIEDSKEHLAGYEVSQQHRSNIIEQILICSCEHQRYRRAAQIVMLEHYGYNPLHANIIWGLHADYHSEAEIIAGLRTAGVEPPHKIRSLYNLSSSEIKIRAYMDIIKTQQNTIVLEDDSFIAVNSDILNEKLSELRDAVDEEIGLVQIFCRGKKKDDVLRTPIKGAEDFVKGTSYAGHHVNFITPYGAEKIMAFLRRSDTPCSIENQLYSLLQDADWIFSVNNNNAWIHHGKMIEGDSIGVKYTQMKSGEPRRTEKYMKEVLSIVEDWKL